MSNIVRLTDRTQPTYRYKQGDISRAITEGPRHEVITTDIEQALFNLLFVAEEEDVLAARGLLSVLLHANQPKA